MASRSWAIRAACCDARWSASRRWGTSGTRARSSEFFLFRKDENGAIKPLPHDNAGYFDFSMDEGAAIRQDMVNALEAFGISVEAAHHEVAAGQHEIDFRYADGLKTADNAITFKFTLKAIAQLHGLYATFMPKPIFGINGSGMHVHQSLYSIADQRNAFSDPNAPYGPSTLARQLWDEYRTQVSQWEVDRYLDAFQGGCGRTHVPAGPRYPDRDGGPPAGLVHGRLETSGIRHPPAPVPVPNRN